MRDKKEALEFIMKEDPLGITLDDILEFMTFEEAKPYLKEEYIKKVESGEEEWTYLDYTPINVINKMKDYMEFAWNKANNFRGLSAWRSIQHYRNWLYMLGDSFDNLINAMKRYDYYGKPFLALISELLDIDWKKFDSGLWCQREDVDCTVCREEILEELKDSLDFSYLKWKIDKLKSP